MYTYIVLNIYSGEHAKLRSKNFYPKYHLVNGEWECKECKGERCKIYF